MRGTCLCGAVVMIADDQTHVAACHCEMCRRWGGGPLLAVECEGTVTIEGAEHITVYRSSYWAERGFCSKCGTHLFYRLVQGNHYALPAGLFQDKTDFDFTQEIFIDSKPAYYDFANKTERLTGEEVFAKFGA